jgi:hypothetical protein
MDRKEIKNIFRTAAKNHGLRSRAARYYLIIGDMHVLCILYHSNFGDGVFIDIRVEPSDGRNNSVAFAEMIYLMYRIAGYDCPHADIIWKLELDSTNISVNETCMIAEWTMSHIKAQWSSRCDRDESARPTVASTSRNARDDGNDSMGNRLSCVMHWPKQQP